MALPRMGIDALASRLHLNRDELVTVVEGSVDKRCLLHLSKSQPAINIYEIRELDSPIIDEFHGYGDNKARILSLFSRDALRDYADVNLIGLVDRDLDGVIRPTVNVGGVYYTVFACLLATVSDRAEMGEMFHAVFGLKINEEFWDELWQFSAKVYCLRGVINVRDASFTMPDLGKCVRRIQDGGFDWVRYIQIVAQQSGWPAGEISKELSDMMGMTSERDHRMNVRLHSTVEYLSLLLSKERLVKSSVSAEDIERHIIALYLRLGISCSTVNFFFEKASVLKY